MLLLTSVGCLTYVVRMAAIYDNPEPVTTFFLLPAHPDSAALSRSTKVFSAGANPLCDRPGHLTHLKFLTGKTRCNQVNFRCGSMSALSQRFF